jgi:GNAT superfamily N-acetyltransferase
VSIRTRRAVIGDESILRDLRLQALTDEPHAFGSTYARELARTIDDWRKWMSPGVTFILEDAGSPRGIVAAARDPKASDAVQLMAMWVHPELRGSGAADLLVEDVVEWARSQRARVVCLLVVDSNLRARRFYERLGFRAPGGTRVRERDGAIEVEMEREIA